MSISQSNPLDPYTAKAENHNLSPQEKINGLFIVYMYIPLYSLDMAGLHEVVKGAKTAMLTTRAADGHMHSRAMNPCSRASIFSLYQQLLLWLTNFIPPTAFEDSQLNLIFIANNVSEKFEELANDEHVNVSFCDHSSTNWASYCGTARVTQDKGLIKKHWSKLYVLFFPPFSCDHRLTWN
jgi:general stress protein 26